MGALVEGLRKRIPHFSGAPTAGKQVSSSVKRKPMLNRVRKAPFLCDPEEGGLGISCEKKGKGNTGELAGRFPLPPTQA